MERKYIKPIDGLRAFSVLLVLTVHWNFKGLNNPFGWIGVQIFFVISGYLITSILIGNKETKSGFDYFKSFYSRRVLRIFPIYYLYLLLLFAASIIAIHFKSPSDFISSATFFMENKILLFTYTFNWVEFINFFSGKSFSQYQLFTHLWSLSIEEQFYLLFPLFIFLFNRKAVTIISAVLIILIPMLRFEAIQYLRGISSDNAEITEVIYRNTFTQADALLTGALLFLIIEKLNLKWVYSIFIFTLLILSFRIYSGYEIKTTALGLTLINISGAMLLFILINTSGWITKVFSLSWLTFMGKISYGIYLYHLLIREVIFNYLIPHFTNWENFNNSVNNNFGFEAGLFIAYLLLVIGISSLSYYFLEKKFLNLKKNF